MIDEFFATEAIRDFKERQAKNNKNCYMTLAETEAVISMLMKGKEEFINLLLENANPEDEEVNKIKALFLGRIAFKDIKFNGFSANDALFHLKNMSSPYAENVILELNKLS